MNIVFWRDIALPIVIALLAISIIYLTVRFLLRMIQLDIAIFKISALLGIWYYVGPIIYNWLLQKIIVVSYEGIEVLYTPIHKIIEMFEKML